MLPLSDVNMKRDPTPPPLHLGQPELCLVEVVSRFINELPVALRKKTQEVCACFTGLAIQVCTWDPTESRTASNIEGCGGWPRLFHEHL